jgi:hypothetical protein
LRVSIVAFQRRNWKMRFKEWHFASLRQLRPPEAFHWGINRKIASIIENIVVLVEPKRATSSAPPDREIRFAASSSLYADRCSI